jgi:hypothetical protein
MVQASRAPRGAFWRQFFWVWAFATALGIVSLALVHLPSAGLARQLFIPLHTNSATVIFVALVVQKSIQLAIFVAVGLMAAHRCGLGAPLLEAWLKHEPIQPHFRAAIIPVALTVAVLLAVSALARAPLFHPKLTQDSSAVDEWANSPAAAGAFAQMEKLGLTGSGPISRFSLGISQFASAVGGEIEGRLFEVSVILLLLLQVGRGDKNVADLPLILIAVLIVALVRTAESVVTVRERTALVFNILGVYGLPRQLEPIWLSSAQTGLRVIPSATALGLLYVYHGIECSIAANFCVAVISPLLTMFLLTHFR